MKRYNGLWEKIIDMNNLRKAHRCARKDKSYYKEVKMVDSNTDYYLGLIQQMLVTQSYNICPSDYTIQIINDKGKERKLMKLDYFPHRIIQWAIMLQLEPIFLRTFTYNTCASIPGRGIKHCHKLITKYLKDKSNTRYCLQLDVRKFYDSISHSLLKKLLCKKIKDKKLLWLLFNIIDSYPGEYGVPIGSYLSQYLANYYLCFFDHFILEELHCKYYVRYMDDMVILAKSKKRLHYIKERIKSYLNHLELRIKDNWQLYPVDIRGISFVGYRYFREYILLGKRALHYSKKLIREIKNKQERYELINRRQFCGANSYCGCLVWCDSWRLFKKLIIPIMPSLLRFYMVVINSDEKRCEKFVTKVLKKAGRLH